jgi:disulfide bond formation protein DsbB
MIKSIVKSALERPSLFIALIAAILLAVVYGFEYNGYTPCDLCWYQRYPYMAIVSLMMVAYALKEQNSWLLLLLIVLLTFVDAGIAGFHAGVEYKWWDGPSTCGGAFDFSNSELTLDNLYESAQKVVRCDEAAWTLGGISLAGYNMLIALGLGFFGIYAFSSGKAKK